MQKWGVSIANVIMMLTTKLMTILIRYALVIVSMIQTSTIKNQKN